MSHKPITENTLFYGDNLFILREHIPSESVDLIYLDPPFNSSRNYNVLFKDEKGVDSESQITAFEDTWHWNLAAEHTYSELLTEAPDHVAKMIESLRDFIGTNQMMAYLTMMTVRLIELHRVLKSTGSLYLHCDPTASHYLKIILDTIFSPQNFRNEIIWERHEGHSDAKRFGSTHDVIFCYQKSKDALFNKIYAPYSREQLGRYRPDQTGRLYTGQDLTAAGWSANRSIEWRGVSPGSNRHWMWSIEEMERLLAEGKILLRQDGKPRKDGYKTYLDEMPGKSVGDVWTDIDRIPNTSGERLGYPTQKPLALLDRIIEASSNSGDVVLDPFCGCGTAIASAQKLGRKWIGIDITHLSIALQKYRLEAMFPGIKFKVVGEPKDIGAARQLATEDRYQFQWWSLSLIRARPLGGQEGSREGKKGSDKGIDGVIAFIDDQSGKAKRVLVQVKSGHVNSSHIRDLKGTLQREQAAIGVFITLEEPTRDMNTEAVSAGFYHSPGWNKDFPRIQIFTIEELLHNEEVKMPPQFGTFKQAQRVQQPEPLQGELGLSTG
jgi:site-specific DNA-methyltransferase (adenine-specific)